jgi:uracil-DNA glycosylase family 4
MSEHFEKFMSHIQTYRLEVECAADGDITSQIAIVGEYPGEQEIAFNKPFTGGSGKHMWDVLRKNKINRFDCYTTYAVKRRVTKANAVNASEFSLWQEALNFELSQLPNLKYIICLGNAPLEALTSNTGIIQYRGSVYEIEIAGKPVKVICSYNPSTLMRQPQNEIIFAMDMQKVPRVINGDYAEHIVNTRINPTFQEAMLYMEEIRVKHKKFATDIECIGMETACIGLAHTAHDAMCINFRDDKTNRYTIAEEYALLRKFTELCDDPTTSVIAQNGNFDSYFMGYKDHAVFRVNFDTLLAHHTLYPRLPHNLGFLTSQYTNHPYYKDDIAIYKEGGDINSYWSYNGKDCAITFAVAEAEEKELRDQGLYEFFISHVMRLQPHLSLSTVTGVLVDQNVKQKLSVELTADLAVLVQGLQRSAQKLLNDDDYTFNPNSPKQCTSLFFDRLHCQASKRSADANTREEIMKDPRTNPDVKDLLTKFGHYAEESKFLSTYVNTKIDDDDRFRAEFKQYGVSRAPGRLSSGGTLWGSGGNAQNQPHRAYEMYLPDEGCVFFYFDLAQAEARYVGWDANIEQWIEDFERARIDGNFDAHRSLAATMFKKPYDEVAKNDIQDALGRGPSDPDFDKTTANVTERFIAKRCRHGLNYRMHIARLAQTTGLSYGIAAQNYYLYHRTSPQLQEWWKELEREVRKTRMQFNCFGRRNLFLEKLSGDGALDSIVAFKPQSSIGDKCQRVWYQCHEDSRWDHNKARICLNVHDALYGIATPEYAKTALSIAKAYAEEPLMIKSTMTGKVTPMIIPADCKLSMPGKLDGIHRMSTMKTVDIVAASI